MVEALGIQFAERPPHALHEGIERPGVADVEPQGDGPRPVPATSLTTVSASVWFEL